MNEPISPNEIALEMIESMRKYIADNGNDKELACAEMERVFGLASSKEDRSKSEDRCFWCNASPEEAAKQHEGPHATWCPHYRKAPKENPDTNAGA